MSDVAEDSGPVQGVGWLSMPPALIASHRSILLERSYSISEIGWGRGGIGRMEAERQGRALSLLWP